MQYYSVVKRNDTQQHGQITNVYFKPKMPDSKKLHAVTLTKIKQQRTENRSVDARSWRKGRN
jgi:hypothetical protein